VAPGGAAVLPPHRPGHRPLQPGALPPVIQGATGVPVCCAPHGVPQGGSGPLLLEEGSQATIPRKQDERGERGAVTRQAVAPALHIDGDSVKTSLARDLRLLRTGVEFFWVASGPGVPVGPQGGPGGDGHGADGESSHPDAGPAMRPGAKRALGATRGLGATSAVRVGCWRCAVGSGHGNLRLTGTIRSTRQRGREFPPPASPCTREWRKGASWTAEGPTCPQGQGTCNGTALTRTLGARRNTRQPLLFQQVVQLGFHFSCPSLPARQLGRESVFVDISRNRVSAVVWHQGPVQATALHQSQERA
jgi:hypothetical protein